MVHAHTIIFLFVGNDSLLPYAYALSELRPRTLRKKEANVM